MDTVVDIIPTGEIALPVKEDNFATVDLLGRQEIVEHIMIILEVITKTKSSCTFALNGAWGTGKTFVLNMLMNQLWEYHSDKYIVFHYNCWQYDYYKEPLIAIVAAMLDSVDEENHLLPENLRDKAKAGMELAKPVLNKIATDFVKNKIGVDLTEVITHVTNYKSFLGKIKQHRATSRSFDEFYSFKKAIGQAQEDFRKLAENHTLVVVVDELDRCLPNYAIKVLERLHHLFSGLANTAVILAVDKGQLDATIAQTFGKGKDTTTKYLRKFVNFELQLDDTEMTKGFFEKHADYIALFDDTLIQADFPYEEFVTLLFSGIDMRTQERLMDRLKTAHRIVFATEKPDYSVLCCELFYLIYKYYVHVPQKSPISRSIFQPVDLKIASTLKKAPPISIYAYHLGTDFPNANKIREILTIDMDGYRNDPKTEGDIRPYCSYAFENGNYILTGQCIIQELLFYYSKRLFGESEDLSTFPFSQDPFYAPKDIRELNRIFFNTYSTNIKKLLAFAEILDLLQ